MRITKEISVEVPRHLGADERCDAILGVGMLWNMLRSDLGADAYADAHFADEGDGAFFCRFCVDSETDFATPVHLTVLFEVALTLYAHLHPEDTADVVEAVVLHETRGGVRRLVAEVGEHAYANHNDRVKALWEMWVEGIKRHSR